MAANLMLGRWASMPGVNTWQVDLQTITLIQGTATYSVPANTIAMLDAYITINPGPSQTNRIILPISRSEFASYPNTQQQGSVTTIWFDRLLTPTLTLYLTPDATSQSLSYYRIRQSQDANLTNGQNLELPEYWLEAAAFGLAWRLALIWAKERAAEMKIYADEAYGIAADANVETSAYYVSPQLSSYWRA